MYVDIGVVNEKISVYALLLKCVTCVSKYHRKSTMKIVLSTEFSWKSSVKMTMAITVTAEK